MSIHFKLGKKSMAQLVGLHPEVSYCVTEAIKITKQDFTAFDGIRSIQKQENLILVGASSTIDSYHLYGLAVDLVPWINGTAKWEEDACIIVANAMKEVNRVNGLGIDWGYDLWKYDMPHFQKTGMKKKYDIRKLRHDLSCY